MDAHLLSVVAACNFCGSWCTILRCEGCHDCYSLNRAWWMAVPSLPHHSTSRRLPRLTHPYSCTCNHRRRYALGIYLLNLLIAFLSPKIDPALAQFEDEDEQDDDMGAHPLVPASSL
jgi:hypothetical protein